MKEKEQSGIKRKEAKCANCIVCKKDTVYCAMSDKYDPDKFIEKLQEQYKRSPK